jgi:hypothetical protein
MADSKTGRPVKGSEKRTENILLRVSPGELQLIDDLVQKRKKFGRGKPSRTDVLVKAVEFALGGLWIS